MPREEIMSKLTRNWAGLALAAALFVPADHLSGQVDPTNPLGHFIYPAANQSPQQQQSDQQGCYNWASQQTGFSPYDAYQQALAAQQQADAAGQRQGEVLRGAAAGTATGLIIGAITGDAGKGAAIGAASGGLLGGMKRRSRQRDAQNTAEQQQQQAQAQLNSWDQAYVVCLQGRNYTVG